MKDAESDLLNLWLSEFGRQYTDRNVYTPQLRIPAFKKMLADLSLQDILEVGCNRGTTLETLAEINPNWQMTGVEPSDYARQQAPNNERIQILSGTAFDLPVDSGAFDLVYTVNVLIHIALQDLHSTIQEMHRASRRYLLVIEYFAEEETEVLYQGRQNSLWKRDFKAHFEEQCSDLKLLRHGFHSRKELMFDDSHWWLWEKGA